MQTTVRTRRFLLIALATTGVALAGCGGSSGSSGLSHAQLAAKVNAACTSYNTQAKAIKVPSNFTTNAAAAAAYLDKLLALANTTFGSIKGLKPGSSVKTDFVAYIAAETRNVGYLATADAKAHAKDPSGLLDLQKAAAFKKGTVNPLATKLGFTACIH